MKKIDNILLIATGLLLVPAYFWNDIQPISYPFFLLMIFLFGIPHGSLDHLIFLKQNAKSKKEVTLFVLKYLGAMLMVAVFWVVAPGSSLFLFLLFSAYHFGQSQLFYLEKIPRWLKLPSYLAWGSFVLAITIRLNYEECIAIFQSFDWVSNLGWINKKNLTITLAISSSILVSVFLRIYLDKTLSSMELFREIALLVLITSISFLTNAVFTFAIYFGLWHSLRSLIVEFRDLSTHIERFNLMRFLRQLLPFSIIASAFLVLVYIITNNYSVGVSPYMLFILLVSTLTLPHLFIMKDLYRVENAG